MNKKGQLSIVLALLFLAALIFYAAIFNELGNIIEESKNNMDNPMPEILIIYDTLPFIIGVFLLLGFVFSFASIIRR